MGQPCPLIRRSSPSLKPWQWSPTAVLILHGLLAWHGWLTRMDIKRANQIINTWSLQQTRNGCHTLRVACFGMRKLRSYIVRACGEGKLPWAHSKKKTKGELQRKATMPVGEHLQMAFHLLILNPSWDLDAFLPSDSGKAPLSLYDKFLFAA